MEIEVITQPAYHVAFIRHISGYSKGQFSSAIGEAFQRVITWAAARDLFTPGTLVIGIPYDNPDITPNEHCRYDACVSVPVEIAQGTGEVGIEDIPGGKYAVGHIEVSTEEAYKIGEMVDRMYAEWLPASGYTVDDKPALEFYFENPEKPRGTWISMDFRIPLKPL